MSNFKLSHCDSPTPNTTALAQFLCVVRRSSEVEEMESVLGADVWFIRAMEDSGVTPLNQVAFIQLKPAKAIYCSEYQYLVASGEGNSGHREQRTHNDQLMASSVLVRICCYNQWFHLP